MEDYEQNKHTDPYTQNSQNSKDKLVRYYKYGLIPILILWLILTFVTTPMSGAFYLMGFMWPYLYYTPGFEDKAQSKAYRYSFLGNIFKFQKCVKLKTISIKKLKARLLLKENKRFISSGLIIVG